MTWFDEGDGWRNEDSEGPADTVRTKYDWKRQFEWMIARNSPYGQFTLSNRTLSVSLKFDTIKEAKAHVVAYEVENFELT